jgi:hypothetical protein
MYDTINSYNICDGGHVQTFVMVDTTFVMVDENYDFVPDSCRKNTFLADLFYHNIWRYRKKQFW